MTVDVFALTWEGNGVPRKLRIPYAGTIRHVMNRGDRREAGSLGCVARESLMDTLTAALGTAIGTFGFLGIVAADYVRVILVGRTLQRIQVARYVTVQEQPKLWRNNQYAHLLVLGPPHGTCQGV